MSANRRMRDYDFALTVASLMNNVLRSHYPADPELTRFRQRFSNEVHSLCAQPAQLKPVGSGLVGVYLNAVWTAYARLDDCQQKSCNTRLAKSCPLSMTGFFHQLEDVLQALLQS